MDPAAAAITAVAAVAAAGWRGTDDEMAHEIPELDGFHECPDHVLAMPRIRACLVGPETESAIVGRALQEGLVEIRDEGLQVGPVRVVVRVERLVLAGLNIQIARVVVGGLRFE